MTMSAESTIIWNADEIWEEIIEWATRMGIMLSDIDVNSNSHRSQVP